MAWHDFDKRNEKVQNTITCQTIRSSDSIAANIAKGYEGQISNFYFLISTFRERLFICSTLFSISSIRGINVFLDLAEIAVPPITFIRFSTVSFYQVFDSFPTKKVLFVENTDRRYFV